MAVVPVLVLLFVTLWFILRGDLFYVLPCVILFLCFSVPLALRLPCLGKRANLSAFRTFVRFVLVWICRFPLPLGVLEGLRFVIVALPGLFSYLFCLVLFYSCFFSVFWTLRLPRLGKRERELILVLFVRLFDLRLFDFVCFLFLLVSGKGCSLWLWHSLDFSLFFFAENAELVRINTSLYPYSFANEICSKVQKVNEIFLYIRKWKQTVFSLSVVVLANL